MDSNQNLPSAPPTEALPQPSNISLLAPPHAGSPEKNLGAAPVTMKNGNSFGALFGIIVIIVVLLLGALYFWGAQLSKGMGEPPAPPEVGSVSN